MDRRDFMKSAAMLPIAALPLESEGKTVLDQVPGITVLYGVADKPILLITGVDREGYDNITAHTCKVIKTLRQSGRNLAGVIGFLDNGEMVSDIIAEIPKNDT